MADLKHLSLYASLALVTACSQPGVKVSQPVEVGTPTQQAEPVADPAGEAE